MIVFNHNFYLFFISFVSFLVFVVISLLKSLFCFVLFCSDRISTLCNSLSTTKTLTINSKYRYDFVGAHLIWRTTRLLLLLLWFSTLIYLAMKRTTLKSRAVCLALYAHRIEVTLKNNTIAFLLLLLFVVIDLWNLASFRFLFRYVKLPCFFSICLCLSECMHLKPCGIWCIYAAMFTRFTLFNCSNFLLFCMFSSIYTHSISFPFATIFSPQDFKI